MRREETKGKVPGTLMAGSPFYVPNCGIPLLHNNPWKPNEVYWSSPPKTTSDNPQSAQ